MNKAGVIFDSKNKIDFPEWHILNDVVMGGVSSAKFEYNKSEIAVFKGEVSLENNGGFCSVRNQFSEIDLSIYDMIILKVKGDGKRFQFRIKRTENDAHSYIHYFNTSGDWQSIEIPLQNMKPSYRGQSLNMEDFPSDKMVEMAFLIGNNKKQNFELYLENIKLEKKI